MIGKGASRGGQRGRKRGNPNNGTVWLDWECGEAAKSWGKTAPVLDARINWARVLASVGVIFFPSIPKTNYWMDFLDTLGDALSSTNIWFKT